MLRESANPIFGDDALRVRTSASDRIRYRLIGAECRYHANDNISAFIREGELDELKAEVQAKMQEVLHALVIDTDSDQSTDDTRSSLTALTPGNKSGATLSPAGEQFRRYASTLVQVWERARHQVAVPPGRRTVLTIGCEISLWDPLLLNWLLWMRTAAPHLAVRTEVGFPDDLLNRVSEGVLDIAVVYAPLQRPGLRIELLIEEKLVMVTTASRGRPPRPADYVYVDWGPDFAAQHGLAFPELSNAGVIAGLGPLGREYLLAAGGSGYFRLDVVRGHLESGRLHRVLGAPEFLYPAYAV